MFNIKTAYAHCDIPCGVYETDTMKHAVETVKSLTNKLVNEDDTHSIARMTFVKEEYSQICKREILILWTDYFKEEHLEKYPDLHKKIWRATKLCSKVKREINIAAVNELEKAVNEIADIFAETKK